MSTRTYDPITPHTVAFLGMGVMGAPMAGHLARSGHQVTVYNRSAAKAQAWVAEYGGRSAPTPRKAATGARIVFCCVGNDEDLRSVTVGPDGAFAGMEKGAKEALVAIGGLEKVRVEPADLPVEQAEAPAG